MKSRISETDTRVKEYLADIDNDKNNSDGSKGRLDLNILLKRLKEKRNSDKKLNFIITSSLILIIVVVLLVFYY